MATSLYDLSVPTFLQTVSAVGRLPRPRGRALRGDGRRPRRLRASARLFADMAPFHFQIEAAWHHAVWGLEAVKTGVFTPPALVGPVPFADLRAMIAKAEAALAAFDSRRGQRLGGQGAGSPDRPAAARLHGGDLHPLVLAAQLPFPRRHRLRHPALARRADRQARLRGPLARAGLGRATLPVGQTHWTARIPARSCSELMIMSAQGCARSNEDAT